MMRLKNLVFSLSLTLLFVGMLAACGTAPLTTGTTPLAPVSGPSPTPSTSSVPATPTPSSMVVSVGQVASHQAVGSTFTILTTVKGFTLYIHEWQGASGFTCGGLCASTWKPLVYDGTGTPTSTTPLPGKLSVGTDAQGHKIVFYQGYPLYTYVGDTKPGDFNAPLADNDPWQLAIPSIPTSVGTAPAGTPTPATPAPTPGLTQQYAFTASDSGRTVRFRLTSRFTLTLPQQTYPQAHLQLTCDPQGATSATAGMVYAPPGFYAVPYQANEAGSCKILDESFTLMVIVEDAN